MAPAGLKARHYVPYYDLHVRLSRLVGTGRD